MEKYKVEYKEETDIFKECEASKITENIFIGSRISSYNKKELNELGITDIVRIGEGLKDFYKKDFTYLSIAIKDNNEALIYCYFKQVINFIDKCIEKNGKVLVHCYMGRSRSVSLVCSYLMKKNNIDFDRALEMIRKHREIADPNDGFIRQLREFYMKEVKGLLPKKKILKKSEYSSYNYMQESGRRKRFKYSKPSYEKPKILKIRTNKINRKKIKLENDKVKLFTILDEIYKNHKDEKEEEIRKKLQETVKNPSLLYKKSFGKHEHQNPEIFKKKKRQITNLITRESNKMINDIIEKNKI